jgi:hypothetical protein
MAFGSCLLKVTADALAGQGIAADLASLEQCANLLFELIAIGQSDESLRDFSVARDYDCRGQTD